MEFISDSEYRSALQNSDTLRIKSLEARLGRLEHQPAEAEDAGLVRAEMIVRQLEYLYAEAVRKLSSIENIVGGADSAEALRDG